MNDDFAALANAKTRRAESITAAAAAQTRTASAAAELDVCKAEVLVLTEARSAAIAAARRDDVIGIDERLLHAKVSAEIAESRAQSAAEAHAAAAVELHDASAAVDEAARAVVLDEMVGLAAEFTAAFDHALVLGANLQALAMRDHLRTPLNVSVPMLPPEVESALDRLPLPDQLNVSVAELRNGNTSRAWFERIAALTAS